VQVLTLRGEKETCGASGACDKLRALFPREPQLCDKELTLLLLVLLDFLLFFLAFQTVYLVLEAQNSQFKELVLLFDLFRLALKEVTLTRELLILCLKVFHAVFQGDVLMVHLDLLLSDGFNSCLQSSELAIFGSLVIVPLAQLINRVL
jgi:hypothetical protein